MCIYLTLFFLVLTICSYTLRTVLFIVVCVIFSDSTFVTTLKCFKVIKQLYTVNVINQELLLQCITV